MPATDRSLDVVAFVSEHFRDIVRRRLRELAGLALITLALLGAIALATWSVQDPSLSHATQTPVHNLLGYPGAIVADLAMQLLGLAAVAAAAAGSAAGLAAAHAPAARREMARPGLARSRRCSPPPSPRPCRAAHAWPLPTGLGGVFGDALLRLPALIARRAAVRLHAGRDHRASSSASPRC